MTFSFSIVNETDTPNIAKYTIISLIFRHIDIKKKIHMTSYNFTFILNK